jgi:hypothetical protein
MSCPKCGCTDTTFLRGLVQSGWRRFLGLHYCAVICCGCKQIMGFE